MLNCCFHPHQGLSHFQSPPHSLKLLVLGGRTGEVRKATTSVPQAFCAPRGPFQRMNDPLGFLKDGDVPALFEGKKNGGNSYQGEKIAVPLVVVGSCCFPNDFPD